MLGEYAGPVEVYLSLNENEGRAEVMFELVVEGKTEGDDVTTGPYYSVLGMTKAFPKHRQEILTASRAFLARNLPDNHRRRLERAIARAEAN